MKLIFENSPQSLLDSVQAGSAEILKSTSVTGVDFQFDDTPEGRWQQLALAAQGTRLWSNKVNRNSPLWAGKLPTTDAEIELVLRDLEFAEMRAKTLASYKVCYIGRSYVQPRNLLVIDHKRTPADRHDATLTKPLRDLLSAAPFDWWGSLGIVSASSPARLSAFLEDHQDVVPMAYTNGATAKLKFAGRDYVHLGTPTPDSNYGVDMRVRSNRLSAEMAQPPVVEEDEEPQQ